MVSQEREVPEAVPEPVMAGFVGGASADGNAPRKGPTGKDYVDDDIPNRLKDDRLVKFLRIRFDEQKDYLDDLKSTRDDISEPSDVRRKSGIDFHRIKKEMERINTLRSSFEASEENDFVMRRFNWYRASWRLEAQKKSAGNLEDIQKRVSNMYPDPEEHHFIAKRLNWERQILNKVQDWTRDPILSSPGPPKDPEELKREQEEAAEAEKKVQNKKKKKRAEPAKVQRPRPPDSYGLTVSEITLRRSNDACKASFMSYEMHKHSLNDALFKEDNNPFTKKCKKNTIRHFHIPANNMHWIEEAIARYYDETTDKPPEYNYRADPNYLKKSSDLLCREYWTSLQHGGTYDPVHARHMRANCSRITPGTPPLSSFKTLAALISAEKACAEKGPRNNFVIFMPYLHWETHKRRKKISEETLKITQRHLKTQVHVKEDLRARFAEMSARIRIQHARALTGFQNCDQVKTKENEKDQKQNAEKTRKPGALGHYLLNIAKLYDAMDVEPDVRMLRDHLFQDPPLHTRRTLDQSYYWKLPNTDGRDEDQVVYRETKEGKDISRTTRVVMVDQLWMYILDDNTIITSFPRRWGRNKPDHSGVHKGIRARLDHLRIGQVQSVYDLALLIMDQCSTVFFDLTKPVDERPEVLDIFSNALSHVSGMKTVAYETFWRHLDKLNATGRKTADFEATARAYLNINPEGELLREVHDIIEELRMMARIYTQQLHVLEDFSRHLENMHQQDEKNAPKEMVDIMLDIKNLLGQQRNGPHVVEDALASHNQSPIPNGTVSLLTNGDANGIPDENNAAVAASYISEKTVEFSKRVCNNILLRRKELQNLEEHSTSVSDQLRDLLTLKQQQASIIEAKLSLERADESVIQGRSIMLFTIVTIIFLPLSFMTSVFGMNAAEFDSPSGGNSMSLKHQFKLIFPISVGVIVVSISLAFSPWIRSIIGFVTHLIFATIIEYTRVRRVWSWCIGKHTPDGLYDKKKELVRKIYSRKEREALRRERDKAKLIDERGERGEDEEDDEIGCLGSCGVTRRKTVEGLSPV